MDTVVPPQPASGRRTVPAPCARPFVAAPTAARRAPRHVLATRGTRGHAVIRYLRHTGREVGLAAIGAASVLVGFGLGLAYPEPAMTPSPPADPSAAQVVPVLPPGYAR